MILVGEIIIGILGVTAFIATLILFFSKDIKRMTNAVGLFFSMAVFILLCCFFMVIGVVITVASHAHCF